MFDQDYQIVSLIGMGGSSSVYHVIDNIGTHYAVKAFRRDKNVHYRQSMSMLKNEHSILTHIDEHPNILKSFAINMNGQVTLETQKCDTMYNLLELAENGSLSHFVKKTGPLEEEICRFFMVQLFSAVAHIHNLKVAHLDIKPENILLDEYFNLKLADFGCSEDLTKSYGFSNSKKGTRHYVAPEILELDPSEDEYYDAFQADMYSVGVTLFVLLMGEYPNMEEINPCFQTFRTNDSEGSQIQNIDEPD